MKTLRNIILVSLPTVLIVFVILELFFRVAIPASNPPRGYFDEVEKIYSLSNSPKEGVYTIGKFAEIRARWRINNMHWNYPIDYRAASDDKPLIAVIGDSFIEALQVDVDEQYPFLLREKLKDRYEVYAFGVSGAPLSQYLHVSRYVNRHFDPDVVVVNIVHNDFTDSIDRLNPKYSYFLQVSVSDSGELSETTPRPNRSFAQYRPMKRLAYKSALFRYLYFNLQVKEMRRKLRGSEGKQYEANIDTELSDKNMGLILKSTSYLVEAIRAENEDRMLIIVMNGPRDYVYGGTAESSNVLWMNEMMDTLCARNNIEFVDLAPMMAGDYRKNRRRFDFELDGHWNEYGHQFVANVLQERLLADNP